MHDAARYLDIDALRRSGARPAWFGLGFVQLKLDESRRLHFWHRVPGQGTPEEEMHDHRYGFTSVVLAGRMVHEVLDYAEAADGDHEMFEVSCKPCAPADPRPLSRGRVSLAGRYVLGAGSEYFFPADRFHRGFGEGAVTFLTRGPVEKELARVVHPVGAPTACPFSFRMSEAECWEAVAGILDAARRSRS